MALTDKLSAIGNAIRAKTGKTDKLTLDQMPTEIESIQTGGGEGITEIVATGNCSNRFMLDAWSEYYDKIVTKDITNASGMFQSSSVIEEIPFDLNFNPNSNASLAQMFYACTKLKSIPKINGCKPAGLTNMFANCYLLRNLPDDFVDWFDWTYIQSNKSSGVSGIFPFCKSLRTVPYKLFEKGCPSATGTSYILYRGAFNACDSLDEIINLPIPYTSTWTSDGFSTFASQCSRLKNLTFALNDGVPYVMNWKAQTIDLSAYVGYTSSRGNILNYNSGITADKEVTDDTTYQALKDDPDWFTCNKAYSRYNHDSAVATINSLPDTSAYLATAGGTNTIKFKGASGSATDGGAINTLTEAEIAVATAKGWTVTLS